MLSDQGFFLKSGFTTGSCATAAAKAACLTLLENQTLSEIEITLPDGQTVILPVASTTRNPDGSCTAVVIKDAGDDHDVTDGIEICATVSLTPQTAELEIKGGIGVGTVTKPGLQIPVGQPAINPKPLEMLKNNLLPHLKSVGAMVTIFVPQGQEIALKTFNPRLGIEGGISIIGTSGIVRPMSEEAFKQSIYYEINQKKALGNTSIVLVPGKHGEKFAVQHLGLKEDQIVHMSNFVGFSLNTCVSLGFESIHLVGHIGKLIKISGGIFQTHSQIADAKSEILIANLALKGCPLPILEALHRANTTDEMSDILFETGYEWIFKDLAALAKSKMRQYVHEKATIEITLYDMKLRTLS